MSGQMLNGENLKHLIDGLEDNKLLSKYSHIITTFIVSK